MLFTDKTSPILALIRSSRQTEPDPERERREGIEVPSLSSPPLSSVWRELWISSKMGEVLSVSNMTDPS